MQGKVYLSNHSSSSFQFMVDPAPSSVSAYLDPHYWDKRFSSEDQYEWLKDYSHFKHLLYPYIHPSHHIIELGCGNSRLTENIHKDFPTTRLTCIDISPTAVQNMKTRLTKSKIKDITVLQADMLHLPFTDDTFDVVIEKGTMDVLFVDSGDPWSPDKEAVDRVMKMLGEVYRVLKEDGVFISVSFGQPHFRRPLFEGMGLGWAVEVKKFGDGFHYFFYTLRKGVRSVGGEVSCCRGDVEGVKMDLFQDELEGEDFLFRMCVEEL